MFVCMWKGCGVCLGVYCVCGCEFVGLRVFFYDYFVMSLCMRFRVFCVQVGNIACVCVYFVCVLSACVCRVVYVCVYIYVSVNAQNHKHTSVHKCTHTYACVRTN